MHDPEVCTAGLATLVFMTLFLDIIGIAIIMPVLPTFLEELTADIATRSRRWWLAFAGLCRNAVPVRADDWQSERPFPGRWLWCCSPRFSPSHSTI